MSFIPKLHFTFHDIPYYVRKYGPLGGYNEETCEAAHQIHRPGLSNYKIDPVNPDFDKLLIHVCTLNARNI